MITKFLKLRKKSGIQKMCDDMKKELDSVQTDSMIWTQMQASALVGDSRSECGRCRR